MQLGLTQKDTTEYITILNSAGDFRKKVTEDTPGAVKREYETSDGKTGEKYELIYREVAGYITGMQFYDGDYGTNLQIQMNFGEGTEPVTVSLNTTTNYGEDFLKKLPNIDPKKPVVLAPYSFTDDKNKTRRGITVMQDDVKLTNYYYDTEKSKNINGYPEVDFDTTKKVSKEKWQMYFMKCRDFLIEEAKSKVLAKFEDAAPAEDKGPAGTESDAAPL